MVCVYVGHLYFEPNEYSCTGFLLYPPTGAIHLTHLLKPSALKALLMLVQAPVVSVQLCLQKTSPLNCLAFAPWNHVLLEKDGDFFEYNFDPWNYASVRVFCWHKVHLCYRLLALHRNASLYKGGGNRAREFYSIQQYWISPQVLLCAYVQCIPPASPFTPARPRLAEQHLGDSEEQVKLWKQIHVLGIKLCKVRAFK